MTSLHTPEYRQLVAELVKARKKAGITQKDLAASLAKPQSFVSKYEKNERRLDIAEYIEIAKILNVRWKTLFDKIFS